MRDVSGGWRRKEEEGEEEEGVTHSWPNARSNRFRFASCTLSSLQREHGGRRERKEGWREERRSVWVCVKKGGGRVSLNSWVEVNKAVSVCGWRVSRYLYSFLSLFPPPFVPPTPSSLATSGPHLLSSFTLTRCRPPSLCAPPLPGSLDAIKHLTGRAPRLASALNQCTHTSIFEHIKTRTLWVIWNQWVLQKQQQQQQQRKG